VLVVRPDFATNQPRSFAHQFEIEIAGQSLKGEKFARPVSTGRCVCHLENRRTLVDLIEHGLVDHLATNVLGYDVLRPEEFPAQPRNLIERRILFDLQIPPAEAGKTTGMKIFSWSATPVEIVTPSVAGDGVHFLGRVICAHRPRLNDVSRHECFEIFVVWHVGGVLRSPA